MRAPRLAIAACTLAALCTVGCGGAQREKISIEPLVLLQNGSYRAARLAAEARGAKSPQDRAVIALSFIGEHPDHEAALRAVESLSKGARESEAVFAATEALAVFATIPALEDEERSMLVAEAALGAAALGPLATPMARKGDAEPKARFELAVALLERLRSSISSAKEIETARVLALWNGCFTLLGGSMKGASDHDSWRLFTAIGGLAVLVSQSAPGSDLSKALLSSTVAAVEESPLLAVPVRCDLASPFDALRTAMVQDRDLSARLERAVEKSLGCSRGKYAPTAQE